MHTQLIHYLNITYFQLQFVNIVVIADGDPDDEDLWRVKYRIQFKPNIDSNAKKIKLKMRAEMAFHMGFIGIGTCIENG